MGFWVHQSRGEAEAELAALRALPAATGVTWTGYPPDQGYLNLFTGGALWPAHFGQNTAEHRIHQVIGTEYRGFRVFAFSYTYHDTGAYWGNQSERHHQFMITSVLLPAGYPALDVAINPAAPPGAPFEQAFTVTGQDSGFTARALRPDVCQWLLGDPRLRYFPLHLEAATLSSWWHTYVYVNVRPLITEVLGPTVDLLAAFAATLPR